MRMCSRWCPHSVNIMQNALIRAILVQIWNQPNLLAITALQANLEDQGQTLVQQKFSWAFIQHVNQ